MTYDLDPEGKRLPIKIDTTSNGEHIPVPLTEAERIANRHAKRRVGEIARKLGKTRRKFLISSAGAAATLLAFNEANAKTGARGGFFDIPKDAAFDDQLAQATVGGDEFIFDIQNHCVDPSGKWRAHPDGKKWNFVLNKIFPQASKCGPGSLECYSARQLVKDVFLDSDTQIGVVSALWGARGGNPIPIEYANEAREVVEAMGGGKRTLIHGGVLPNEPGALDFMEVQAKEYDVAAWKLYPQWGPDGVGFFLDDPKVGVPFVEKARALGIKVVCAHRGIPLPGLKYEYSHPRDMGAVAKMYPDVTFITYHSGFEPGKPEGAYDAGVDVGVNRLIKSFEDAGFKRNEGNLYAELGGLWKSKMGKPDEAAHVIGKLVKHMGEDRICWGTDTIWNGSPQDQIQAMRTFQISKEFQDRYGYPEITKEMKAKIFGLNAAGPYKLDVKELKKTSVDDPAARLKAAYQENPNPGFESYGPKTRREFFALLKEKDGMPA